MHSTNVSDPPSLATAIAPGAQVRCAECCDAMPSVRARAGFEVGLLERRRWIAVLHRDELADVLLRLQGQLDRLSDVAVEPCAEALLTQEALERRGFDDDI